VSIATSRLPTNRRRDDVVPSIRRMTGANIPGARTALFSTRPSTCAASAVVTSSVPTAQSAESASAARMAPPGSIERTSARTVAKYPRRMTCRRSSRRCAFGFVLEIGDS
jgi:hypothetical protein